MSLKLPPLVGSGAFLIFSSCYPEGWVARFPLSFRFFSRVWNFDYMV